MNECANCLVFQWEQPDVGDLQKCTRCKVLQYCSKDCQKEHWMLVHKGQCKHLAKTKALYGSLDALSKNSCGPNETLLMLVWKTLVKIKSTDLFSDTRVRIPIIQLEEETTKSRAWIEVQKKVCPATTGLALLGTQQFEQTKQMFEMNVESMLLWSTLHLLWGRIYNYNTYLRVRCLKEPKSAELVEFWSELEDDVGLFPIRVAELTEAFSGTQFPTFTELLKIWCGGSLVQNCSFCKAAVTVAAVGGEVLGAFRGLGPPGIILLPYMSPIIYCGGSKCTTQVDVKREAWNKFTLAVNASYNKLSENKCDHCFKLANEVHRCSKCLTKNYCSRDCQQKDWEEKHQELCNSAADKRKMKGGEV